MKLKHNNFNVDEIIQILNNLKQVSSEEDQKILEECFGPDVANENIYNLAIDDAIHLFKNIKSEINGFDPESGLVYWNRSDLGD